MTFAFPVVAIDGEVHADVLELTLNGGGATLSLVRGDRRGGVDLTAEQVHELASAIWEPIPELPNRMRYPTELYELHNHLSVQSCGRVGYPHNYVFFNARRHFLWGYLDRPNVERLSVVLFNLKVYGGEDGT